MAILSCLVLSGTASAADSSSPRLLLKPARFAQEIAPGFSSTVTVEARNETARTLELQFVAIDLQAGEGESFAAPAVGDVARSALEWVTFDGSRQQLEPDDALQVDVKIDVPSDARPGAYAFAVAARQVYAPIGVNDGESIGSKVELRANLASTFVIVVPGAATASAKVVSHESPRLVWGSDEPVFDAVVENDGDTLLKLEAATELSSFGAFASRTLKSAERPTLPGGRRELRMEWTDRPWIGWFTPRLVVVGGEGSGVRVTEKLPTVFVLPPWWVLVLLAIAIALPLRANAQRRRRIRQHHARLHAAALADDDQDSLSR